MNFSEQFLEACKILRVNPFQFFVLIKSTPKNYFSDSPLDPYDLVEKYSIAGDTDSLVEMLIKIIDRFETLSIAAQVIVLKEWLGLIPVQLQRSAPQIELSIHDLNLANGSEVLSDLIMDWLERPSKFLGLTIIDTRGSEAKRRENNETSTGGSVVTVGHRGGRANGGYGSPY